jgi:hypothetical protein
MAPGEAPVNVRVGAGHNDEGPISAGVDGGLNAIHHLFGGLKLLDWAMTTARGFGLIFDVYACGADLYHLDNSSIRFMPDQ